MIVLYCSTAAILLFDFIYKCPSTVYIAKIGFIISYLSVFVVGLFKGKPFKIAENILLVLAFVNLAMDVIVEMTSGVRFNDYVVSEIINKYSGDDVVFFYFPDHGLDIFESNDSFCGHGLISDPESWRIAVITPFLAFYSERFAEVHPELILMLQEKAAQPFCTDTFIYLLAETLGVKTLDGINTSDGLK